MLLHELRSMVVFCAALTLIGCGGGSGGGGSNAGAGSLAPTYPYVPPSDANIAYASASAQETLDLYLPTIQTTPSPVVIWIHGGAFTQGDKSDITDNNFSAPPQAAIVPANGGDLIVSQVQVPDVAALLINGYAVVSLNYRLAPNTGSALSGTALASAVLQAGQDAKAAVRFLRANAGAYHLDPNRFAVWGNSAGGFMAGLLGTTGDQSTIFDDSTLGNADTSSAVQAVVAWYGIYDAATNTSQLDAMAVCDYLTYLPRPPPTPSSESLSEAEQYSPVTYIPTATVMPPFMLAHGNADCSVPYAQSQELYDDLIQASVPATLNLLNGAGHEDPMFMQTQMVPAFNFLNTTFGVTPVVSPPVISD
jgi:acetyl esterase/lipase